MALRIDIVSDIVCPWCFIGTRRLKAALATFPNLEVELAYRPFLLDPTTPKEGQDLRERLRAKYGGDPDKMFAQVERAAHASGIPLDFSKVRRSVSTVAPHTLLRHALEKGTQPALAEALFAAYFLQGRDVSRTEVLVELGRAHGFDEGEVERILAAEAELDETRAEASEASRGGITGVPFTILGGALAVSGAQEVNVFRRAIERALSETSTAASDNG